MASRNVRSPFASQNSYAAQGDEEIRLVRMPLDPILTDEYQRDRKKAHIEKIAAEFDPTAYAFPIVAEFQDSYFVLDGQQRLAACEKLGHERVFVLLIEGVKTRDRLAEIFLRFNRDRKLLDSLEKYAAARIAKDRGVLSVGVILSDFNQEPAKSASVNGRVPIGAVMQIFDQGGKELLERVLRVKTQAWGNAPSKEQNEGKTLLGLALFLRRHWETVDDGRLISILSKHHPGYLLEASDQERGSFKIAYAKHLFQLYNRGIRGKARLTE